jgi:hypothetical protein
LRKFKNGALKPILLEKWRRIYKGKYLSVLLLQETNLKVFYSVEIWMNISNINVLAVLVQVYKE